jgi:Neprosin
MEETITTCIQDSDIDDVKDGNQTSKIGKEKERFLPVTHRSFPRPERRFELAEAGTAAPTTDNRTEWQKGVDHRWYAEMIKTMTAYGISATFSRFRPQVEDQDFSLIQLIAINQHPSHPTQTVEAGWRRYRTDDNDSSEPEVFIFYTAVGYDKYGPGLQEAVDNGQMDPSPGHETGDFQWIIPAPRSKLFKGLPVSHIYGAQLGIGLKWSLVKNDGSLIDGWYLAVNDQFVGYYPTSIFEKTPPAPTSGPNSGIPYQPFKAEDSLSHHATQVKIYGEVYDHKYDRGDPERPADLLPTTTDMGSGKFPSDGRGQAAFISNIQARTSQPGDAETWVDADNTWSLSGDDPANGLDQIRYNITFTPNYGTSWGAFCLIGGSGEAQSPGTWTEWDKIFRDFWTYAPAPHPLAALATGDKTHVFGVPFMDDNANNKHNRNKVYHSYWKNYDWSAMNGFDEWDVLDFGVPPSFDPSIRIKVVPRNLQNQQTLDIFALGTDGHIWTATYIDNGDWAFWTAWQNISPKSTFQSVAQLAAVSRSDDTMDVFVNNGNTLYAYHWDHGNTANNGWFGDGEDWYTVQGQPELEANTTILAIARDENNVHLFVTDTDGDIQTTIYTPNTAGPKQGWSAFGSLGSPGDGSGTKLAGVSRMPDRIDVFMIGADANLYSAVWSGSGWLTVGGDDTRFWGLLGFAPKYPSPSGFVFEPLSSDISAVIRKGTQNMDVLVGGVDGKVYRTAWDEIKGSWLQDPSGDGIGWDRGIGGAIRDTTPMRMPFNFTVVSRIQSSLTVLLVDENGWLVVSEYQGP